MNDQEIKALMEANLELTKENNHMLKKIRGVQKRSALLSAIRWLVFIAAALGLIYYIRPFISKITQFYNSIPILNNIDMQNLDLDKIIGGFKP
jgi:hypothetical protein